MRQSVALPLGTLTFEREGQWLMSDIPVLDPAWRYIDAAGHEHTTKTLVWVVDWEVPAECCGTHSEGHWECPLCHERITPGTKEADPVFVTSFQGYYLNDEPITREQALALLLRFQQQGSHSDAG